MTPEELAAAHFTAAADHHRRTGEFDIDLIATEAVARCRGDGRLDAARPSVRLSPSAWGEACSDFEIALCAIEGLGATHHDAEPATTLENIRRAAFEVARDVALLVAVSSLPGAFARWRTLFELSVSARFIDEGATRVPGNGPALTAREKAWIARPLEERRAELARRYRDSDALYARDRALTEWYWLRNKGFTDLPDRRAAESVTRDMVDKLGATNAVDAYAWAFPASPRVFGMDALLSAVEDADSVSEFELVHDEAGGDPVVGRRIKRHRPRKLFWQISSQALHRGQVSAMHIPIAISMALEETAHDVSHLTLMVGWDHSVDALAQMAALAALGEPARRLLNLILADMRAGSS